MLSKQYDYVIAVAETGSFSKAAKELYIAQSSLSQFIKNLEDRLGVQLFDRNSKPITPTEAGKRFLKTAYDIRYMEDQMEKQLSQLQTVKKGSLTIGITRYWGSLLLPRILPEFQIRYPNVELNIIEGRTTDILKSLEKKQVEIAFLTPPSHLTEVDQPFQIDIIYYEEIMLAAQKSILQGENQLSEASQLEEISQLPFILLRKGQKMRQIAESFFQSLQVTPKILMETENITSAYKLASVGFGATFIPKRIKELTNPVGPVEHIHLDPPLFWSLAAMYEKNTSRTEFFEYLLLLSKKNIL